MSVKYKSLEYKFSYKLIDEYERKRQQINKGFFYALFFLLPSLSLSKSLMKMPTDKRNKLH